MPHQPSLFAREDTMLGVCEGFGQELGINPLFLRIAFGLGLFWSLEWTAITYLALGVALALFRWAFPLRTAAAPAASLPLRPDNDDTPDQLAEAA